MICLCSIIATGHKQVRRRAVPERLVRAAMVVEMDVILQRHEQIVASGEIAGIDQFVFQRPPQAFDEDVVQRAATPIHADGDAALL